MHTENAVVPECAVCLQPYDDSAIVPRVLACGHSFCESCISSLSQSSPQSPATSLLRCPECSLCCRLPTSGAHGFPKNIELLRCFSSKVSGSSAKTPRCSHKYTIDLDDSMLWELCRWIVPQSSAKFTEANAHFSNCGCLYGHVSPFSWDDGVTCSATFFPLLAKSSTCNADYFWNAQSVLASLSHQQKQELLHVLRISRLPEGVCSVFGFWMNTEGVLYFVCRTVKSNWRQLDAFNVDTNFNSACGSLTGRVEDRASICTSQRMDTSQDSDLKQCVSSSENEQLAAEFRISFLNRGLKLCELFMGLHREGLIAGLLTPDCLSFDEFHRLRCDVGALFCSRKMLGYSIRACFADEKLQIYEPKGQSLEEISGPPLGAHYDLMYFVSPEVLSKICGLHLFSASGITCKADSWILGCLLWELLCGEMPRPDYALDNLCEFLENWMEKANTWITERASKLNDVMQFARLLVKCFAYRPEERPDISQMYCLLSDIISNGLDRKGMHAPTGITGTSSQSVLCLAFELDIMAIGSISPPDNIINGRCNKGETDLAGNGSVEVEAVSYLNGHADYITALALCGENLLSASFDKTICVWSVKDGVQLKTLKGHTHRVTALAIGTRGQICISGDYGSEIWMWDLDSGYMISKWHHHQDWRYSGVASLAASREFLYSGGGDRIIKAWSMEDQKLVASMEGHTSVVSALLLDRGVLYSGSWDGTIQLWWCMDHSALCVLPGSMQLGAVRALAVSHDLLLAGYQNGSIQVWKDETCVISFGAHDSDVSSLYCNDINIFSGSWDGSIKVWRAEALLDAPIPRLVRKCESAVTCLVHTNTKLYAGLGSKTITVFSNLL